MSIHNLAEHVRSHGRGEDTMLIHMTPKEVAGLQALAVHHGGSLTINPKTGLPEAGFLSKILPIIAGVGLSFVPGVGPLMAGALVGSGGALATGSLSKGLMMGLGAFGGAGLAGGIAAAGINSLAGAGGAAAEGALASGAAGIEGTAAANALPSAAQLSASSNVGNAVANNAANMAMGQRAATAAAQTLPTAPIQGTPGMAQTFMDNARSFPSNLATAAKNPMTTASNMPGPFSGPVNTAMYGAVALSPAVMSPGMHYKMPNSDEDGGGDNTDMPKISSDFYARPMYSGAPNPIQYPYKTHFNSGGITSMGYSAGGKLIVGPGDGMSDDIPARLGSGQEAKLADGEFVVPADVVSGMGNGSTKAGAQQLYAMMDRVRQKRTGRKVQPKAMAMRGMLPA